MTEFVTDSPRLDLPRREGQLGAMSVPAFLEKIQAEIDGRL